ncbi:MAG TPA: RHS repeat-associated core domain-containing protein [Candidatus Didemnitutus sp.]|nr:RHS repeat-associated core domain-containing protein [Candidatus Didemnitutus sp.]
MDSLIYRYQTNRNRLTHVDDPGGVAGNHSFDVDDQDTNTYTYDASGNMIGDTASGITSIVWTPSNKIQSITKGSTSKLEYTYDAMGNRVVKRYYQPTSTLKSTTWYARDAQGNILSVYERPHADSAIKQSEVHIYGSSRLGIEQRGITYSTSNFAWIGSEQHRNAGSKRYELTDHLGNVRVTISDLLVARPTGFGDTTQDAEVIDRRDYYPFGMEMPGRRWRATGEDAARFGFNGKENDNEVKGEGNAVDYGARMYDPRIGRWMSVDPLASKYPSTSAYVYVGGNPIAMRELDGRDFTIATYVDTRGRLHVDVVVHAKLVNRSSIPLDEPAMYAIAARISSAYSTYYSKKYPGCIVNAHMNICPTDVGPDENTNEALNFTSSAGAVSSKDHVVYIVDQVVMDEILPGALGEAAFNQNYVLLSSASVLTPPPDPSTEMGSRGLTPWGQSTLERTSSHEFGHSGGLWHIVPSFFAPSKNLMSESAIPFKTMDPGTDLTPDQIQTVITGITTGATNGGQQVPDVLVDKEEPKE